MRTPTFANMLLSLKILGWLLLATLLLAVIYVLCALLISRFSTEERRSGPKDQQIYLTSNGVHIDVVLARSQAPAEFQAAVDWPTDVPYTAFGWGDKGFYLDTPTWAELQPSVACRAMLINSPTAMHLINHYRPGDEWVPVDVSADQLERLLVYLSEGFAYAADGTTLPIPDAGYTAEDRFYEAEGSYHAFVTCNTWINRGLKYAGLRTAVWAAHDEGVLRHFRDETAAAQTESPVPAPQF